MGKIRLLSQPGRLRVLLKWLWGEVASGQAGPVCYLFYSELERPVERNSWVRKQGGDPESCLQRYIGLSSGMVPRKPAELPEGPGKRGGGNES